jgi:transcriptional regulator with XRE-family HTH domain
VGQLYEYEIIVDSLGSKLREIRKQKGLSLRAVADLIDVEENNYSRFELKSSQTNPTLKTVLKICNALEISIDELL